MELLDANGLTEEQYLKQYDPGDYPQPSMTVDIVVFTVADIQGDNYRKLPEKELRVLLIRRGGHPYIDHWALPGGFVNPDETVGEAANRELEEETGIRGGYLEQLYTFSKPGRDPRAWVISCAHMALIDSSKLTLQAGSDAADARWFKITAEEKSGMDCLTMVNENIRLGAYVTQESYGMERKITDNDGLAFDHAEMIACAIGRLRAKIEYTDLVFRLMPERFTLTQLQQVYEAILGKPLYKAAFRRKIMDYVSETGMYTQDAGHRPSQLFMRRRINRFT
ncbi:MAG: NUDIX hydrolase [Peptococcaceae bacterium]|jgi:ADP-ribose pyrophosphatase YjhB (NUDIX family)|nr:NUDIX hydrolase [Peptococcaceae bacterium]